MSGYLPAIVTLTAIAGIAGLALNLQWGLSGIVNFGLVGFYALGAYTAATAAVAGVPPLIALALAMAVAAAASAAVSLLSLRLGGDYLAIVTLAFAEALRILILNEAWLTGGAIGLPGIPSPLDGLLPAEDRALGFLVLAVGSLVLAFLLLEAVARAPLGRALRALRDDPLTLQTLGRSVVGLRAKAMAIGGAVVGLAGALHAFYYSYIEPTQFAPTITAYAFMAVILGGRGSNRGLLLGAGSVMVLIEASRFLKDFVPLLDATQLAALRLILIGAGLIAILIYRPQGLLPEHRLEAERETTAGEEDHGTR